MNWDDLRIFDLVMREGNLTAAARKLAISQTTVSRRMQALEVAVGTNLIERTPEGYVATEQGRALVPMVRDMVRAAAALERWKASLTSPTLSTVRVAAAAWATRFLTKHYNEVSAQIQNTHLEIISNYGYVNLDEREADIAIWNKQTDDRNLHWIRLANVTFAAYGSIRYVGNHPAARTERRYKECEWVGYVESMSDLPVVRWLEERGVRSYLLRCATSLHILDGIKAGVGLGIVPAFLAEHDSNLVRVTAPIERGGSTWAVMHNDLKDIARVTAVADALVMLFEKYSSELNPC